MDPQLLEKSEKFKTLRTLYWVLEISDDINILILILLWWIGYHTAFTIILILWIIGAFSSSSRYGVVARLQKELELK